MDLDDAFILYSASGIYLHDKNGEIVMWLKDEWVEDPDIVFGIAQAIEILAAHGGNALRQAIGKKIP